MNNRSLATMISTLTLLTLFTACSKVKELENRTKNMEQSTSEMKSITAFMYPQVRTKETEDTRSKKMAIVLSPNAGMGEKIAAAAVYYQSFEFHFWNDNDSYDTEHTREKLFLDAINEFYRRMKDIYEFSEIEKMSL